MPGSVRQLACGGPRAVIFDIGGVLEVTPSTGWQERWAARLRMSVVEMDAGLSPVWELGEVGGATVLEIERHAATVLGLTGGELRTFVEDVWTEYLGTLNRDLARYFASLRPRYRTGILSNSFVGARELERRLDTGAAGPASRGGRGAW